MTAEEMEALAPAPEGWRWEGTDALVVLISRQDPTLLRVFCAGRRGKITAVVEFYQAGSLAARSIVDLDALLALRRLAGHLWPWPGWPVVEGVRPAGWGPWTRRDVDAHQGDWLVRVKGERILRAESGPAARAWLDRTSQRAEYCAVDADGRWVEVDTRGGR